MKIVSMGAALLDQIASVERFPKEDDEVFAPDLKLLPGGSAANFAVMCARLGAQAGFVGKVGSDFFGDYLIKDLRDEGVGTDLIPKSSLPTGTVFIAVRKDGQRMMFAHSGAANDLKPEDIDLRKLNKFDNLHLADLENIAVLQHAASNFANTISLNPGALIAEKPADAKKLIELCDIIILSEEEAERITGARDADGCLKKLDDLGAEVAVITRGAKDPVAISCNDRFTAPVLKVKPVDTTGAGDSFSAGFVCEYSRTKDVGKSLRFANAVASIVIQHPGARGGLRNRAQVEALL
jgi:ribokinase